MIELPISHWVWSQMKGEEPRCTGTIREVDRDEHWISAECDGCVFPVAITRPRIPSVVTPEGYDVNRTVESSSEDAPF